MTGDQLIRVLHCPCTVGGNAPRLAAAERELGLESRAIIFHESPYQYPADEVLCLPVASPLHMALRRELKRPVLLWRALRQYDIVHFNFGETTMPQGAHAVPWPNSPFGGWLHQVYGLYARLLEMRDLPLLRKAGKGIVVTFQGNDARQGDFCREHFAVSPVDEVGPGYYDPAVDAHKRERIVRFNRYADRIYSVNPDLLHVLPDRAEFIPYANIDLRDWKVVDRPLGASQVPVVVHAPSHRGVKGTRFILDSVARLKAERVPLEFVLVEGLSHAEARRAYERADLLVDQLLCGWYGGVAVEFMALGKPVICYMREDDLKFIPADMRQDLPIINATPDTVYEVLKLWLTARKGELADTGRRSRAFVERWHDPLKIAARLKNEYEAIVAAKRAPRVATAGRR